MNAQGDVRSTGLDPSFGEDGVLSFGLPGADYHAQITVGPDNRIVALGGSPGSASSITLVRFDQDGAIDPTFGVDGVATIELFSDFVIALDECVTLPDGRVVVLGLRSVPGSPTGPQDYFCACVGLDGSLDPGFGDGGIKVMAPFDRTRFARGLMLHPGGKVLALLEGVQLPELDTYNALVRLDQDGQPDASFGTDGVRLLTRGEQYRCHVARPDGRVLLGGSNGVFAEVTGYDANGELDLSFGHEGLAQLPLLPDHNMFASNLALQEDGRIIVQGVVTKDIGNDRCFVMKLRPDGERDHTFNRAEPAVLDSYSGQSVLIDALGQVSSLERDEGPDTLLLRTLPSNGFSQSPPLLLPIPGAVHHSPPERLSRQVPGTILASCAYRDQDSGIVRLAVVRLLA